MIPALEHDYEFVSVSKLRAALNARGGIGGWNLAAVSQHYGDKLCLYWSRQAPASPNTGETR